MITEEVIPDVILEELDKLRSLITTVAEEIEINELPYNDRLIHVIGEPGSTHIEICERIKIENDSRDKPLPIVIHNSSRKETLEKIGPRYPSNSIILVPIFEQPVNEATYNLILERFTLDKIEEMLESFPNGIELANIVHSVTLGNLMCVRRLVERIKLKQSILLQELDSEWAIALKEVLSSEDFLGKLYPNIGASTLGRIIKLTAKNDFDSQKLGLITLSRPRTLSCIIHMLHRGIVTKKLDSLLNTTLYYPSDLLKHLASEYIRLYSKSAKTKHH